MKKVLCLVLVAFSLCGNAAAAPLDGLSAASFVLYDPVLAVAVYQKNAHEKRGMASTTKIMTALLALELYDLDAPVEIKAEWCGVEGSSFYLRAGEIMSAEDLIYGLMLASGNDAALALASIYSGIPGDFIALMNKKAAALGMENTHFENASGLGADSHYSTAFDMALLTAHALENPAFAKIASTRSAVRAGRYLTNHNRLLRTLDGAVGVKTGYTKADGRCLVSACTRQGKTLIAVTLNAPDDWRDHASLYERGFDGASEREILSAGIVGAVAAANGAKPYCALETGASFVAALTDEQMSNVSVRLLGPRMHYGAARAGEIWGRVAVCYGDKVIFDAPVFFGEDIDLAVAERGFFGRIIYRIYIFFR